jgi:hypothetical protein
MPEDQFHANISLWHLCTSIVDRESLDGLQPMLIEMLKLWWDIGYYPASAKDYTDIPNVRIRNVILDYLKPVLAAKPIAVNVVSQLQGFNNHATKCVICFNKYDKLVRFHPCGHRLFCMTCAPLLSKCPICLSAIGGKSVSISVPLQPGETNAEESDDDDSSD